MRRIIVLFLTLCLALPIFAADSTLYNVTMPVADQSEEQRMEAFAAALEIVANRLQADNALGEEIDLSEPMEHPEQYVESFSYVTDPEQPDVLQIKILFDRQALQPFLPQQQAAQSQQVGVQVIGITSLSALDSLNNILTHITRVQSVVTQRVYNDKVNILVAFQGNVTSLIQALVANPHLTIMNPENMPDRSLLYFQWTE